MVQWLAWASYEATEATKSFNDVFQPRVSQFEPYVKTKLLAARAVGDSLNVQPDDAPPSAIMQARAARNY